MQSGGSEIRQEFLNVRRQTTGHDGRVDTIGLEIIDKLIGLVYDLSLEEFLDKI